MAVDFAVYRIFWRDMCDSLSSTFLTLLQTSRHVLADHLPLAGFFAFRRFMTFAFTFTFAFGLALGFGVGFDFALALP